MEYDWEKTLRKEMDFIKINKAVPRAKDISVVGVAVAFQDLGEACFIANPKFVSERYTVWAADLWADIHGDVDIIFTSELSDDDRGEEVE